MFSRHFEYIILYSLLNDKKRRLKYLVLGPSARRTFRLSSRTPLGYLLTSCPGKFTFNVTFICNQFLKNNPTLRSVLLLNDTFLTPKLMN